MSPKKIKAALEDFVIIRKLGTAKRLLHETGYDLLASKVDAAITYYTIKRNAEKRGEI